MKQKVIMNWSAGKDSSLALYKLLLEKEYEVGTLLTTLSEKYNRVSMHGVRVELLEAQAKSINLPLEKIFLPESPSMEMYEKVMNEKLLELRNSGFSFSAFGDIYLEDLKKYREEKLSLLKLKPIFPLWKISTEKLMEEFFSLGFKAIVTCVSEKYLDKSFAGRFLDDQFLKDLPANVDPCGENGEFHTFVFDGPIFNHPIRFNIGEIVYKKYEQPSSSTNTKDVDDDKSKSNPYEFGYWFCDLIMK